MNRRVIAVVPDLFFLTRIQDVARQLGVTLEAAEVANAFAACRDRPPDLVVLDLADPGAVDLAAALRADPLTRGLTLVGFYPHVDAGLRERALAAGVTHVLPRSAFTRRIAELLVSA